MMNIISRKMHGLLDYLVGSLLIASPWLFDFYDEGITTFIPITLGLSVIIYSLLTSYEYSVANVLPFPVHLVFDTVAGIFLAASPWIFNFSDSVYIPHLASGLLMVVAVLLTDERLVNVRKTTSGKIKKPRKTQLLYTPWNE